MSTKENKRDSAFRKNPDESMKVKTIQESMTSITHKFVVMSSKGGVGKTSVLVNLALSLAKKGKKVGLMDTNFHGPDIHTMLGLEPAVSRDSDKQFIPMPYSENLKVASIESYMQDIDETGVWGWPLEISDIRHFISSVNWGSLDYLFVDTPSGPGEGLLTVIRTIPEAKTIIVTAPNKIGGDRAKNVINFVTIQRKSLKRSKKRLDRVFAAISEFQARPAVSRMAPGRLLYSAIGGFSRQTRGPFSPEYLIAPEPITRRKIPVLKPVL